MKIINFSEGQTGYEWLTWRRNGIGSSDISVIMRSNPYLTPLQLWEIKCGYKEVPINNAMRHGIENEPRARQWMNAYFEMNLVPLCVEDADHPEFRASVDGYDEANHTLCEIKCPISETVLEGVKIAKSIPDYWYDQVQWQMMLTGTSQALIAVWDYREKMCHTMEIPYCAEKILEMKKKAKEFWNHVKMGQPPKAESKDYILVEDPELEGLLDSYKDLDEKQKVFSKQKDEIKKKILEYGNDTSFTAFGYKMTYRSPRTSYDMEKMKKDGIPIEEYKKIGSGKGSYRISCPK